MKLATTLADDVEGISRVIPRLSATLLSIERLARVTTASGSLTARVCIRWRD